LHLVNTTVKAGFGCCRTSLTFIAPLQTTQAGVDIPKAADRPLVVLREDMRHPFPASRSAPLFFVSFFGLVRRRDRRRGGRRNNAR
jgi:hypothetical protein